MEKEIMLQKLSQEAQNIKKSIKTINDIKEVMINKNLPFLDITDSSHLLEKAHIHIKATIHFLKKL